jgi:GNAT superfamily N-acetyltransferase
MRSKAHWGYDDVFMEKCRDELTVRPEDLSRLMVPVAEVAGDLAGFAAVAVDGDEAEVWFLFVDPPFIGSGVGRRLWYECVVQAQSSGARRLRVEADPFAEDFYARMGAVRVGEVASQSIAGRQLPLLVYEVPA